MISNLTFNYFPRLHTALAEWLACIVFIYAVPKRFDKKKTWMLNLLFLPLLIGFNLPGEGTIGFAYFLWCSLDILLMIGMIWSVCNITFSHAVYQWSIAFVLSEMAASMEWQFSFRLIKKSLITTELQVLLVMVVCFAMVYGIALFLKDK